ncbi:Plasma membrane ATP-binding cassette transporter required for the export of a-factor [Komagataella phaffii CBS 7435]|uniref:Plasma membrane ATP-binding cassette (ABC) transporter required for the export of a-factor n=2 Tax=Komagataella phaffii TaxID=460519 RepID=C4R5S6_KOMPG|nr:Plasma membrane ATP-binding cassette (ABC) transporter required for the export of a-factor [Komagataella phaffii GS115]AOA63850.1 GQ67_03973T0 [Komagataella phaffii]CAH2449277.1 Plasma membrane ATP-binding cassette transporter required for the export of a-factor [Komagataella phaffii CBS 7435]AOA68856.1 GQ68_03946T0 [Komagataella phaffii GS115]CAY70912.1 Plasma membrane ATP-binding cassette (ABC) transporter required for the export of a-factor [Komagataella phaffii GS115]CCA39290.1 Plasma m
MEKKRDEAVVLSLDASAREDLRINVENVTLVSKNIYMFMELKNDWFLLFLGTFSSIVLAAAPSGMTVLMGLIFTQLQNYFRGDYSSLGAYLADARLSCFSLVLVGLGSFIFSFLSFACYMQLGERQQSRVRKRIFESLLFNSISWHEANKELNGELVQINRCIEELRIGVSICTGLAIQGILSVLALLITSFIYSWSLTFVIISTLPVMFIVVMFMSRTLTKHTTRENDESSYAAKIVDWVVRSPIIPKICNAQTIEYEKFKDRASRSMNASNKALVTNALNLGALKFLTLMMFVQGFWYGSTMVRNGRLSAGDVVTCFGSSLMLAQTISGLSEQIIVFQEAIVALNKVVAVLAKPCQSFSSNEHLIIPPYCKGDIFFKNVSFEYPTRKGRVLDEVSIEIPAGKHCFIVGKSGSGKSTLSNLLVKFYSASQGKVFVDGYDIERVSNDWLTKNITLVQQSSSFFNDTLRANILLGSGGKPVSERDLRSAIDTVLLSQFIDDLPEGLETVMMYQGISLSGGQEQRLAIARALIRDTPILILDECVSALEESFKSIILNSIKEWRQGKTTIFMEHDYQQIQNEDNIIFMENGEVKETGTKEQLLKNPDSKFSRLVQIQRNMIKDTFSDEYESSIRLETNPTDRISNVYLNRVTRVFSNFFGQPVGHIAEKDPFDEKKVSSDTVEIVTMEERPEDLMSIIQIFRFMNSYLCHKSLIVVGILLAVLNGSCNPVFSWCFAKLLAGIVPVDSYVGSARYLLKWALLVILVISMDTLTLVTKKIALGYASEKWIYLIRTRALKNLLLQDMNWFSNKLNKPAEISALLVNDSRDLKILVSSLLEVMFTGIVVLVLGSVWSITIGWKLSLVAISVVPLFLLSATLYARLLETAENGYKNEVALTENQVHEATTGIKTIRCLKLESHFVSKFSAKVEALQGKGTKRAIYIGFGNALSLFLVYVAQAVILYYGMKLVSEEQYTVSQLMEVMSLMIFALMGVSDLMQQIPDISRGQRAGTYLIRLLGLKSSPVEVKGNLKPQCRSLVPVIEFVAVDFQYPHVSATALNNISFRVSKGEVLGIVGPSGSGKSTIAMLINRLFFAKKGCIRYNGVNIKDIEVPWFREQVTLIQQKPTFFDGSIRENLAYGMEGITDRSILRALKLTMMDDYVRSLPEGLDTFIGSLNSVISGGQSQRLSVARAILREPRVIVMDEPTSSLDPENTQGIKDLVDKQLRASGYTVIIVTHSQELMRICDRILTIEHGKLVG